MIFTLYLVVRFNLILSPSLFDYSFKRNAIFFLNAIIFLHHIYTNIYVFFCHTDFLWLLEAIRKSWGHCWHLNWTIETFMWLLLCFYVFVVRYALHDVLRILHNRNKIKIMRIWLIKADSHIFSVSHRYLDSCTLFMFTCKLILQWYASSISNWISFLNHIQISLYIYILRWFAWKTVQVSST